MLLMLTSSIIILTSLIPKHYTSAPDTVDHNYTHAISSDSGTGIALKLDLVASPTAIMHKVLLQAPVMSLHRFAAACSLLQLPSRGHK